MRTLPLFSGALAGLLVSGLLVSALAGQKKSIEIYRHVIVARVDQSVLRHTAEVWNSGAAVESRAELLAAAFTLWQVGQDLLDTRVALDLAAEDLDDEAAGCRRAAAVEAQAAQASRVSKSTGVG